MRTRFDRIDGKAKRSEFRDDGVRIEIEFDVVAQPRDWGAHYPSCSKKVGVLSKKSRMSLMS